MIAYYRDELFAKYRTFIEVPEKFRGTVKDLAEYGPWCRGIPGIWNDLVEDRPKEQLERGHDEHTEDLA
jgi:hypothetical protein